MEALTRTTGQSAMLPGAVIAGNLVFTSGVVAPQALAAIGTDVRVPVREQIISAVEALMGILADAGAGPAQVVKIEAYLDSTEGLADWNEAFLKLWPQPGPARTTLVAGFTSPAISFELQAIASIA